MQETLSFQVAKSLQVALHALYKPHAQQSMPTRNKLIGNFLEVLCLIMLGQGFFYFNLTIVAGIHCFPALCAYDVQTYVVCACMRSLCFFFGSFLFLFPFVLYSFVFVLFLLLFFSCLFVFEQERKEGCR